MIVFLFQLPHISCCMTREIDKVYVLRSIKTTTDVQFHTCIQNKELAKANNTQLKHTTLSYFVSHLNAHYELL